MKAIIGYALIAAPFLFLWLGVPVIIADEYDTYWDGFKITSGVILFTGLVIGVIELGIYLVASSY